MEVRKLDIPAGYDLETQRIVGLFAAQLDNQLSRLKKDIAGLSTAQLEWQPRTGVNTVGMLLAHLAVVEIFWINVAVNEMPLDTDGEQFARSVIGIGTNDDGLPLKPDGAHPESLPGKTLAQYEELLDKARASVHNELHTWHDSDLETIFALRDRRVTRSWTVYHVLEHFASHYGQILMLKHMMRDAGVLAPK